MIAYRTLREAELFTRLLCPKSKAQAITGREHEVVSSGKNRAYARTII
jgi:hypothetical protein